MNTNHVYRVHEDDNYVWDTNLLMWVPMTQPLVNTGSLTVNADVSDRAGRLLGHVTVDNFPAAGLTNAELRATPVPVSATDLDIRSLVFATDKVDVSGSSVVVGSSALPTGAATEATLLTRTKPADQQHVIVDSSASIAVTGPLTDAELRATPVPVSVAGGSVLWSTVGPSGATIWDNTTALNTAVAVPTQGYGTVAFKLLTLGSVGSADVTFERSIDNQVTWHPIIVSAIDRQNPMTLGAALMLETIPLTSIGSNWEAVARVEAYTHIRIRLSSVIIGAGTFSIIHSESALPTPLGQPAPMQLYGMTGSTTKANAATVRPASSLAAATDTALVVTLREGVAQATASSLNAQVVGNIASGAADSGNPVKVGGVYRASPPTLADGNRADLEININGFLMVAQAGLSGAGTNAQAWWMRIGDTVTGPVYVRPGNTTIDQATTKSLVTAHFFEAAPNGVTMPSTGAMVEGKTNDATPTTQFLPLGPSGRSVIVEGNVAGVAVPISAVALPLPAGAATLAAQTQPGVDIGDVTVNNAAGAAAVNVQDGGNSLTVDTPQLPAALVGGRLDENVGAWLGSTAPTVGSKTSANSVPVVIASDQGALNIRNLVFASDKADVSGSAVTAVVSGTVAVSNPNTQYAEDVASVGGESLTLAGAVRSDGLFVSTSDDGDYTNLKTDSVGRLRVDASSGSVIGGAFYPDRSLVAKFDELIDINSRVLAAMLLLLNVTDTKSSYKHQDLTLN